MSSNEIKIQKYITNYIYYIFVYIFIAYKIVKINGLQLKNFHE